ncbi:MAG: VOC family protein [Gammaproteobacteria bacterium]|nr:VOC family protein [Gammaproteobacteria bacterium]
MHLLRAGTVTVSDLGRSRRIYERWLDYETIEQGSVAAQLAASWGAPGAAGAPYALLQPASKAGIYLRLVEAPAVPGFVPLVTYGWAALEFCVRDVLAVNERLLESPFEIIGPPRRIEGLDAIFPMQVQGPDGEICYFTQINSDLPGIRLPRARSFIDHLFINVLASSDMRASQQWMVRHLGFRIGRESMEIVYTMLARAFGTPMDQLYTISTMVHDKDVFLEVDQMPAAAAPRTKHDGLLPPGVAITTFRVADLDAVSAPSLAGPRAHDSRLYHGQRSMTVTDPDGTLFELVEAG